MDDLSFGAIGAALIAAVVSVVGLILGKEQKTSEFRQAWIDALRAEIVAYLTQAATIRDKLGVEYPSHKSKVDALAPHYSDLNKASHGIKLRLNAKEEKSGEVLEYMAEFERLFSDDENVRTKQLEQIETRMLQSSQDLLKSEWKRVKRGEFAFWFAKYVAIGIAVILAATILYGAMQVSTGGRGDQEEASAPDEQTESALEPGRTELDQSKSLPPCDAKTPFADCRKV